MTTGCNGQLWSEERLEVDPSAARAGLGKRLRTVRQRRLGLTLAEFGRRVAELAGRRRVFSNVTVANWESGRQEPNFATLQAIARLADLPLSFFAGVGELDEFPRINWFAEVEHENDARLREALQGLQELPDEQRRLAMAALTGLLEGLHAAQRMPLPAHEPGTNGKAS
jgi:transcriptional regulator with XRE-family HTH domain